MVKHDLENLEFNIYHTWMKELKKILHKMIVPAVIGGPDRPKALSIFLCVALDLTQTL
ncbi:hypothetical protein V1515DRAFT_590919, partial [Lipomyces mesembrius]